MRAAVIVSTVHWKNVLIPCLQSLCAQRIPASAYEIVLTHHGNLGCEEKAIVSHLRQQYPHLTVVMAVGKNRGQAINEAIHHTSGELLLFTESHCLVHKDWVADYLGLFERDGIEVATGNIVPAPSNSWVSTSEAYLLRTVQQRRAARDLQASFLDFHNTAITRRCFERFGGLSVDIPMMAEFELGARLHQSGTPITRFQESVVYHFNQTQLLSYVNAISQHGMDRTRIMLTRERGFVARYFPSRRFLRLLPAIRILRLPLLGVTGGLLCATIAGFWLGQLVGSFRLARLFFRRLSDHSHQFGQLRALAEYDPLTAVR